MRVLLYGMQSSGASVVAFTLAQKPGSVAFVDIWNAYAAPEIAESPHDFAAKVVVTTAYSLEEHRHRFRPDATVLVLRHPGDTYHSLFGKPYANDNGLIDEKFSELERVFCAGAGFDHIVYYEDFAFCPAEIIGQCRRFGWAIDETALLFSRPHRAIEEENLAACPEIVNQLQYGHGNIQGRSVLRDRVRFSQPWGKTEHLPRICPAVYEHYAQLRAQRGEAWHVPTAGILSCPLQAVLRELTSSGPIPRRSERSGYALEYAGGTPQCRVADEEIVLYPGSRKAGTQLTVSGLPGSPFNRVRGTVYAEHPLAQGMKVRLSVRGAEDEELAEQNFVLSHSSMRNIDLAFEAGQRVSLSLSARLPGKSLASDFTGVVIRELRLEQAVR